jgi:hypothetical protein
MNDFDLMAELKKYKAHLIGMSVAIFSLTLILSLCGGRKNPAWHGAERPTQIPRPSEGILLDFSDPQLDEDRLRMPQPLVFHTRRAGANLIDFERSAYVLDDAQFEEVYPIRERRETSFQAQTDEMRQLE